MTPKKSLLLASSFSIALAGAAAAEDYRAGAWQPQNEQTVIGMQWFADELDTATDGEINFEVFPGGVLYPPKASLTALEDNIVQMGTVTTGYLPSDLPLSNSLSGFGFMAPNPTVLGAAYADWVMHDPRGHAEFADQGVIAIAGFSTPMYPIICNTAEPITELEQLQGLKIRFPGGANATLAEDLGAIPVNIPATDIYQALQTGAVDCAGILAGWLNIDNSLEEVSKSTTLMDWTGSFASPLLNFNEEFWAGLTPEQRSVIFEKAARAHARVQIAFNETNQKALDMAEANGHIVIEPGESIQNAVSEWVDAGVGDMAGVAKSAYGIEDPQAVFDSFEPYVEKWSELIGGMEEVNDEDALTTLFIENMYNDLDTATFGVE